MTVTKFHKSFSKLRQNILYNRYQNYSINKTKEHKVIAIRREDQSIWERRAPLAPNHVRKLVRDGIKVIVQPSNRRAFQIPVRACNILPFMSLVSSNLFYSLDRNMFKPVLLYKKILEKHL